MTICVNLDPDEHAVLQALTQRRQLSGSQARRNKCFLSTREIASITGKEFSLVQECLSGLLHVGAIYQGQGDGERLLFDVKSPCDCPRETFFSSNFTESGTDSSIPQKLVARSSRPRATSSVFRTPTPQRIRTSEERASSFSKGEGTQGWGEVEKRHGRIQAFSAPAETWTSQTLARYFLQQIRLADVTSPAAVNFGALAGHMSRWVREDGLRPAEVKLMVDLFCKSPERHIKRGKTPWLAFLAQRAVLHVDAQRIYKDQERESHRNDQEYWLRRSVQEIKPESYWTQRSSNMENNT